MSKRTPAPPTRQSVALGEGPVLWASLLIVALAWVAYANSFRGPLIFDDRSAIEQNPSIEHLWPVWSALHPPSYRTVTGRPVANLSLAINHALGGADPRGYHVGNWLIHVAAGLIFFGIVRRTLRREPLVARFGTAALPLALTAALVWVLHPLQTEAVTYIIQRVESLMGLFYLLTLYCFIRATEPGAARAWRPLAVLVCLLGMGTKEVMVSAPLLVLLYDRTFVAGSFRCAWERRRGFYVALGMTWLWLAVLVAGAAGRNGTAGLGAGVSSWTYLLTQCRAVVHYLRLCFWPDPLVFDYGFPWAHGLLAVMPQALVLLALALGTIWALWRRPAVGFLGVWFFAILAPSSSVVPIVTQGMAEHRMYLSLAAIVALVVMGAYALAGKRSFLFWVAAVGVLGALTARRNLDYSDEIGLWRDTIAKCPDNPRAHDGLGNALGDAGRLPEATAEFRRALEIDPSYVESRNNLGVMLDRAHQTDAAIREFRRTLAIRPDYSAVRYNLANALAEAGQTNEALRYYHEVLAIRPDDAELLEHVADAEMHAGDTFAAIDHYQAELALRPTAMTARFSLAYLLASQGRSGEAKDILREGIRLDPHYAMAHYNLGNALAQSGELAAAAEAYGRATELDPSLVAAHFNLGNTFALLKRLPEAIQQFEIVLKLEPHHAAAQQNLRQARLQWAVTSGKGN